MEPAKGNIGSESPLVSHFSESSEVRCAVVGGRISISSTAESAYLLIFISIAALKLKSKDATEVPQYRVVPESVFGVYLEK